VNLKLQDPLMYVVLLIARKHFAVLAFASGATVVSANEAEATRAASETFGIGSLLCICPIVLVF